MESAQFPANEASRKAALDALAVLDTPAEQEFDDLAIAASLACGVPISLISLVDSHRQWFKANVGLPGVSETPRDVAFCAHAIHGDAVFEVPNALADERFSDNPLVTSKPDIRFYAGAPITLKDGSRVGTLCVIDRIPHQLTPSQREILTRLASAAARALETRRAEMELNLKRQQLDDILDATSVGTWFWNIKTGEFGFDERWAKILGRSLSELQPISFQTWMDHVHPDDVLVARRALDQHLIGELPSYECEMRMHHKNGGWSWVLARGRVVRRDDTGRPLHISGVHIDISDIKLAQEKLVELNAQLEKRTLEAEAANSSKSTFLSNMSHEMRTPINAIMGVQQILARTPLSADQQSLLLASTTSAQSLLALVNDILDMSKIEAGKLDIVKSAFSLNELIQAVVTMLQPSADAKKLSLLLEIAPEVPPVLLGDSMRLRQVLLNLGSNAVKFTESGEVRVSIEVIGRSGQNVQLRFSVKDTGIGIPPEKHAHIFGAFNQADSSTTRQYGGTGLGLSISWALVRAMGSAIELHSQEGQGSTFSFDIRLAIAPDDAILELPETASAVTVQHLPQVDASSTQPGASLRLQGLRILVAEDQAINRKIVEHMLVQEGASVELVEDGRAAVDAVQKARQQGRPFDAVLMDLQMPVLNGLKATREIREIEGPGSNQALILALTANAMTADVQSCLDAGMNGHIAKPIIAEDMLQQLIAGTTKAQAIG